MFAQAQIIGHIGKIEVRTVGTDKVANFSVACNEKRNGIQTAHWFSVAAWGRLAEVIEQYTGRGSQVAVHGRLTTRKYEKEGQTHVAVEITATAIELLGAPNAATGTATASTAPQAITEQAQRHPGAHRPGVDDPLPEDDDNDLPF